MACAEVLTNPVIPHELVIELERRVRSRDVRRYVAAAGLRTEGCKPAGSTIDPNS